jgi:hypothetical protein
VRGFLNDNDNDNDNDDDTTTTTAKTKTKTKTKTKYGVSPLRRAMRLRVFGRDDDSRGLGFKAVGSRRCQQQRQEQWRQQTEKGNH